jgi:predicted phosphodiesterase
MSTYRIISDLHLEFGMHSVEKYGADNLILAGDIVNFKTMDRLEKLVDCLKPYYKNIIYILGNHEYYNKPKNYSMDDVIETYKKLCAKLGIIFLENGTAEIDGVLVWGATFWSVPAANEFYKMNDCRFLRIDDIIKKHKESYKCLEQLIGSTKKQILIITHHFPSYRLVHKDYKYSALNSCFCSESDNLIKSPVTHWVFGHTHKSISVELDGVKFYCNPYGYVDERNEEFNQRLVISS